MTKKRIILIVTFIFVTISAGLIWLVLTRNKPNIPVRTAEGASPTRQLNDEFQKVTTSLPELNFVNGKLEKLPQTPFLQSGCQGEYCGWVKNLILAVPADLFTDADEKSHKIVTLPKGHELKRARIFIKTLHTQSLPAEEGIILNYGSEGLYSVLLSDGSISDMPLDAENTEGLKTEEWVYVETQDGIFGWVKYYQQPDASPVAIFESEI